MDAAILIRDLEPFRQARPVWDRRRDDPARRDDQGARLPALNQIEHFALVVDVASNQRSAGSALYRKQ